MVSNTQLQTAVTQISQIVNTALQNPNGFVQQFLTAMNNSTMGQQLNSSPLAVGMQPPGYLASLTPTNPVTGLLAGTSAAQQSMQYSVMEAQRDMAAGQNWDDLENNAGNAWNSFWKGDFSAAGSSLTDAFSNATDFAGNQFKAWEYDREAHKYADMAGAQVTMAGQGVSALFSPTMVSATTKIAQGAGINGPSVTQTLNDFNDSLDKGQSTWLSRTI